MGGHHHRRGRREGGGGRAPDNEPQCWWLRAGREGHQPPGHEPDLCLLCPGNVHLLCPALLCAEEETVREGAACRGLLKRLAIECCHEEALPYRLCHRCAELVKVGVRSSLAVPVVVGAASRS